jgi:hypothetical protein
MHIARLLLKKTLILRGRWIFPDRLSDFLIARRENIGQSPGGLTVGSMSGGQDMDNPADLSPISRRWNLVIILGLHTAFSLEFV